MDDTAETLIRTPAYFEAQRQCAMKALAAARTALRSGMMATAETKLELSAAHLRAMAPRDAEGRQP